MASSFLPSAALDASIATLRRTHPCPDASAIDNIPTKMLVYSPMKHWDQLYDIAMENYGIITFSEARSFCNACVELPRWVSKGWLVKRGRGVYRLAKAMPDEKARYAEAVALCGGGCIYGESVLALHDLALVNPCKIKVAVNRRINRTLPEWVDVVHENHVEQTVYFGIPCQRLSAAIKTCKSIVPRERLISAVADVEREGLIFGNELVELKKEIVA